MAQHNTNYPSTVLVTAALIAASGCNTSDNTKHSPPPNPPSASDLEEVDMVNQTAPVKLPSNK